jgi:Carboxypeptidase regulatory-like domain
MLLSGVSARADVTNVMSSAVSYEYREDPNRVTGSGTLVSALVSYEYANVVEGDTLASLGVMARAVSYKYPDPLEIVQTAGTLVSRAASYQYYEWPGDVLSLLSRSSARVSYYYNIGAAGAGVVIYGNVSDPFGAALGGATVMVSVLGSVQATTQASVSGSYALGPLPAGVYLLQASLANYALSGRVLTISAGTAQQNFQLSQLGAAPTVAQTTRQPAPALTQPPPGPMGSTLKVFDGAAFVAINANNAPAPGLLTIVLTHGWTRDPLCGVNDGIAGWPTAMAKALRVRLSVGEANIVGWDWFGGANACPLPPEEHTPSQGVGLGVALQTALGSGYSQRIHFMGHSLGALVNAAAANYLHGDATAQQGGSTIHWLPARTQMTLFDQAEVSSIAGKQVVFDGLTMDLGNPTAVLRYAAKALQGWRPSMPMQSAWADNYISLVGFYLPNTFNVAMEKAEGIAALRAASESSNPFVIAAKTLAYAHSYPMDWYSNSIVRPTDTPLGFQQSSEYGLEAGLPASVFPSALYPLGDAYHQTPDSSDELAVEPLPAQNFFQLIVPLFGNGADVIVQGADGVVHVANDVVVEVKDGVHTAGDWISQGASYVEGQAELGAQKVVNLYNSAVLHLSLHSTPPTQGPHLMDWHGETNAPVAWLPVYIPSNIVAMAFDFSVSGNPFDDVMVCGIATSNLFSLEAKYIPTNVYSTSRLMDVSAWAGATNELFFGLMGGTSTNATLEIENIRFFALEAPRLDIALAGSIFVLSWPESAAGYSLQSTSALAPANWQDVTNIPVLVSGRYALTNAAGGSSGYYRLKK